MAGARKITVEFLGDDKSLSKTAHGVEGTTSKLGARLKQVGKVAAIGLAAGVVVAGKALWEMGQAAAEDEKSTVQLANALKRSAGATKAQIAQTEDWITSVGKNYGIVDDKLRPALASLARATGDVGKAQKLAGVAMNVSAGTGQDLEAVSKRLAKAYTTGNVKALAAYGVEVKNADGSTKSFAQVQEQLSKKFGGSASKAANTFSGKMQRLRVMFDEAKEAIGYKLLPIAEKLANWFMSEGLPAIKRFSEFVQAKVVPVLLQMKDAAVQVFNNIKGTVAKNMDNIRSTISSVISIVQSLWQKFGATIVQYAQKTWANIKTVIGGALQVISGIFKVFSSLLKGDWSGVWAGIKQILSGAWQVIIGLVRQGINLMRTALSVGMTVIKGIFGKAWDGIKSLASSGVSRVVGAFQGIPGSLKSLGSSFYNAGKNLMGKLWDGIKNGVGKAGDLANGIANGIIDAINYLLQKVNDLIPDKIALKFAPDINLPDNPFPKIPHLAKGGIVKARRGGTLALLGEAGADEAVLPLSGPNAPRVSSSGDFSVTAPLVIQMDSKSVWQGLLRMKRTNGIVELGLA